MLACEEWILKKVMDFGYPLLRNVSRIRTIKSAAKVTRDQLLSLWYKANNTTPIVKDPIAIFAAEWPL